MRIEKYADILPTHHIVPLGIKTSRAFGLKVKELLLEVSNGLMEESGKLRSYDYLMQRISVAVRRRNKCGGGGVRNKPYP